MCVGAVVPSWGVPGREYHLQEGHRLSIWLSEALGDENPWMNALLSPGQPGSQNLLMDTGLHRPWGSLPASIAPKDHLKPALFRNKTTVFYDRSPWSLLSMAVEKALGEKQQKHSLNDWVRGPCLLRGPGDRPLLQQGSLWLSPLAQGQGEMGKMPRAMVAWDVAASPNAPCYRGWCSLM